MIDGMVGVLEGEQIKDDEQDKWCLAELDKAKEEAKQTEVDIGDLRAAIEQQRDAIASVTSEIEALKAGLVDLDKSVADATEQRKKEHEDFTEESASNQAAVELLGMAKNRLNKFYNPTVYVEPEKAAEEEEFFCPDRRPPRCAGAGPGDANRRVQEERGERRHHWDDRWHGPGRREGHGRSEARR